MNLQKTIFNIQAIYKFIYGRSCFTNGQREVTLLANANIMQTKLILGDFTESLHSLSHCNSERNVCSFKKKSNDSFP